VGGIEVIIKKYELSEKNKAKQFYRYFYRFVKDLVEELKKEMPKFKADLDAL